MTIQQAFELALQHHHSGRLAEAEALYRQILAVEPRQAHVLHLLGVIAHQMGRNDLAVDFITQAIALLPRISNFHSNLGETYRAAGLRDEAIASYRQALELEPNFPEAHSNLGNALCEKGQVDEAIAACRQAIRLKPNYPKAHYNLGVALFTKGELDEAVAAYRQAIALQPDLPEPHNNLAITLKEMGQLDEAIAAHRQAIAHQPSDPEAHSNLLFTLHCHPGFDARSIAEEVRRWSQRHAEPLRQGVEHHPHDLAPERRLRIGYVSPDLRAHAVGRLLLPLLTHHDRQNFEIFCYADVPAPDAITQELRAQAGHWHSLVGLTDQQAAALIREHQIDILVDLALHTARNRLLVFARKPAPVQVTYLAYAGSSGLRTMDYRLSDPYLDPPGGDESVYSEQTIRLPETYWCYQPSIAPPEVGSAPALTREGITFGCLNNFCKVSEPVLATWGRLLRALPDSRLLLHAREGSHRQRVWRRLEREGIEPKRVRFAGYLLLPDYFRLYHEIDVALDTFPYAGGTTTLDALWMGVPVVTLAGQTAVGRGGASILTNVGLPELMAHSQEEYVGIATALANDLPRLSNLRSTLRARMEGSPLMNAPRFARHIEAAYREMWRRWCAQAA